MHAVLLVIVGLVACWTGSASAQTTYSYFIPYGTYAQTTVHGFQASTVNAGYLDIRYPGLQARDPPQSCLNDVYYYDLSTPFGQALASTLRFSVLVRRIDFTKNSDGRCWLTLLQIDP
jgi:hypothetical protein